MQVGVAYYPEGKGHATRMLGVAQALERRGAEVMFAGGGPGTQFVEAHGHDVYRATTVEFIRDYQYCSRALVAVLTRSLPRSCQRVRDLVAWLRRTEMACLVTDDMFAAVAATLTRTPFYVVDHNAMSLYDAVLEQSVTWGVNRSQEIVSERVLYPAVWPPMDSDPTRVRRIPPIALEAPNTMSVPKEGGVLLVPSHYSEGYGALARRLRLAGFRVTNVGSEDWEPVPALLPWIRAADVVVCSGYSTIMEAAVAGTPCIIWPATDEQHGVARKIERTGTRGFQVEHSMPHIVRAVASPPAPPAHDNGIDAVADTVLADRQPRPDVTTSRPPRSDECS